MDWSDRGEDGPRIEEIIAVPAGVRVRLRTPLGHHSGHLVEAAATLEAALRVQEVRVTRELEDASMTQLLVFTTDPWLVVRHGMAMVRPSKHFGLGCVATRRGRGRQHRVVRLAEHNMLLGGEPGAGKSAVLNLVVAAAALDPVRR